MATVVFENPILLSNILDHLTVDGRPDNSGLFAVCELFWVEATRVAWRRTKYSNLGRLANISSLSRWQFTVSSIQTLVLDSPIQPLCQRQMDELMFTMNLQNVSTLVVSRYIGTLFLKRLFQQIKFQTDFTVNIRERSRQLPGEHLELMALLGKEFPEASIQMENVSNISDMQKFRRLIRKMCISAFEYTMYVETQCARNELDLLGEIVGDNNPGMKDLALNMTLGRVDDSQPGLNILAPLTDYPQLLSRITSLTETHTFAQDFQAPTIVQSFGKQLINVSHYKYLNMFAGRVTKVTPSDQLLQVIVSTQNLGGLKELHVALYGDDQQVLSRTHAVALATHAPHLHTLTMQLGWARSTEKAEFMQLISFIRNINFV